MTTLWHLIGWTHTLTAFKDGEPAWASGVKDNFLALRAKLEALGQDSKALAPYQHPDRYYPIWRFESDFYLTLPIMAGNWAGTIYDDESYWYWTEIYFPGGSPETPEQNLSKNARYNVKFMASSGGESPERIRAGAFLRRAPDIGAQHNADFLTGVVWPSKHAYSGDLIFDYLRLHHHFNQSYRTLNQAKGADLSSGNSIDYNLQYTITLSMSESVLADFYALMDLTSATHVNHWPKINLHLNIDYLGDVTSPYSASIPLGLT